VHTRVVENYAKSAQGVHLNFVSSLEKSMLGGHTRTVPNSERINSAREGLSDLLNTLRRRLCKKCIEQAQGVCKKFVLISMRRWCK
jgi:hypothetical protein